MHMPLKGAGWERFDAPRDEVAASFQTRGHLRLTRKLFEIMGEPTKCEIWVNRDTKSIGVVFGKGHRKVTTNDRTGSRVSLMGPLSELGMRYDDVRGDVDIEVDENDRSIVVYPGRGA